MINNYIKNIIISENNNKLVIYFKNNVFNESGNDLNIYNFRLHLLLIDIYQEIELTNILKNDNDSYTLFFEIEDIHIKNDSVILIELLSIFNEKNKKLNSIQDNNYCYLNINEYENQHNYFEKKVYVKKKLLFNTNLNNVSLNNYEKYINRSSPLLAYQNNQKNFRLAQIRNQKINLSTRLKKYTNSYYSTSYDKKFVPTLEINPTK